MYKIQVEGKSWYEFQMILPHELFAAIYHGYREYFFTYIVPSLDVLKKFWRQVKGSGKL